MTMVSPQHTNVIHVFHIQNNVQSSHFLITYRSLVEMCAAKDICIF